MAKTQTTARTDTAEDKADRTDDKGDARKTDTKGRIIAAAEEVVLRDGVAHLTLEATAAEAGLSKGGVLYHFPTRDALVLGMVSKIIDDFDGDIEAEMATLEGPGRFTRAYIRATMMPADPGPTTRTDSVPLSSPLPPPSRPFSPLCRWPLIAGRPGWSTTGSTRSPPLSCGWPPTGSGCATCSGLAPPPAALRASVGAELERLAAPSP